MCNEAEIGAGNALTLYRHVPSKYNEYKTPVVLLCTHLVASPGDWVIDPRDPPFGLVEV